jgi:hypothetical protein
LNKNFAIFVILEIFFCSTLSEFQNFLVCERILINLTTCQNEANFKDFQRFGAFGGLVEQKKTLYSTRSCVIWAFFGMSGPV